MADKRVDRLITTVAELGIDKASQVFSKLIKHGAKIEVQRVYVADIAEVTAMVNNDDTRIIGASVDLCGEVSFKFLFYVDEKDSMMLTDFLLRRPSGTQKEYDKYVYSTVQEIGNILSSSIATVFAASFKLRLLPQPPAVIHSFVGAVFEEYVMSAAANYDEMLVVETTFQVVGQDLKSMMYIVPFEGAEKLIDYVSSGVN